MAREGLKVKGRSILQLRELAKQFNSRCKRSTKGVFFFLNLCAWRVAYSRNWHFQEGRFSCLFSNMKLFFCFPDVPCSNNKHFPWICCSLFCFVSIIMLNRRDDSIMQFSSNNKSSMWFSLRCHGNMASSKKDATASISCWLMLLLTTFGF